ncbi:hypothetical protein Pelo_13014 [Pelomyxa schiedti]|nr:hypothetical protein Pelo_13014 [Pelomyxa schiedti]
MKSSHKSHATLAKDLHYDAECEEEDDDFGYASGADSDEGSTVMQKRKRKSPPPLMFVITKRLWKLRSRQEFTTKIPEQLKSRIHSIPPVPPQFVIFERLTVVKHHGLTFFLVICQDGT